MKGIDKNQQHLSADDTENCGEKPHDLKTLPVENNNPGVPDPKEDSDSTEFTPIFDPVIYERLPSLLKDVLDELEDPRQKDILLAGILGVVSGCLPNVFGRYDHSEYGPNLFVFVVAPASSGKGVMSFARIYAEEIDAHVRTEIFLPLGSLSDGDLSVSNRTGPRVDRRPWTKKLVHNGNTSATSLIRNIAVNNGRGILFETEGDTIGNSMKQDWGNFSDVLRKAFHHEHVGLDRVDNSIDVDRPQLSVVLSGTPDQIGTLIPSVKDGLWSRFMFYAFMIVDPFVWKDITPKSESRKIREIVREKGTQLFNVYKKLDDRQESLEFRLTTGQWKRLNDFGRTRKTLLVSSVGKDGVASSHRLTIQVFRIAMILTLVCFSDAEGNDRRLESLADIDLLYADDISFDIALSLGHCMTEHLMMLIPVVIRKANHATIADSRQEALYKMLPGSFQRKDAIALGKLYGWSSRTIDRDLKKFVEQGRLEKGVQGQYKKVESSPI